MNTTTKRLPPIFGLLIVALFYNQVVDSAERPNNDRFSLSAMSNSTQQPSTSSLIGFDNRSKRHYTLFVR